MKSHRVLIGLSVLFFTTCLVISDRSIWDRLYNTLHPTPETESPFLKNYTSEHVIEQFESQESSGHVLLPFHTAEGGREFVSHVAGFNWLFALRYERCWPLISALKDDVSAQLVQNGAQILSQSGDVRNGFLFDYKLGHSIGSVSISPLQIFPPSLHRGKPLPEATVDVAAHIYVVEKWFPKEPGTATVKISASTR
jgi:hypothetical protein